MISIYNIEVVREPTTTGAAAINMGQAQKSGSPGLARKDHTVILSYTYVYTSVYVLRHTYVYIYIYIHTPAYTSMYMYIYIYIYLYLHAYRDLGCPSFLGFVSYLLCVS